MDLTELKNKEQAKVVEITGGEVLTRRLESMGIRRGKKLTKVSGHFWKGPITIMVDKTRIAIGHGMAKKITVKK